MCPQGAPVRIPVTAGRREKRGVPAVRVLPSAGQFTPHSGKKHRFIR